MLARSVLACAIRRNAIPTARNIHTTLVSRSRTTSRPSALCMANHRSRTIGVRRASGKALADEKIEEITELFATAKDEFEIAMEETEKISVYAEDDRIAAREELEKVQKAFRDVVEGQDKELAEEVQRRIGQRIRELEQGVKAMEELAQNQD